ncbi:MAG: hypothetical protein ACKO43_02370 [Alphaproteobacteria bacterium]
MIPPFMIPVAIGAALLSASAAAAHQLDKTPAGPQRGFIAAASQPWEALKAPFEQFLGRQANRFNLNGPTGIIADAIKELRETARVLSLLHLQNSENWDIDNTFTLFSNGRGLQSAQETLRHFTDAFLRCPEMTARAMAYFNKNTNNALAVSSERMHNFLTYCRTMILPRFQEAAL